VQHLGETAALKCPIVEEISGRDHADLRPVVVVARRPVDLVHDKAFGLACTEALDDLREDVPAALSGGLYFLEPLDDPQVVLLGVPSDDGALLHQGAGVVRASEGIPPINSQTLWGGDPGKVRASQGIIGWLKEVS